MTVININDEGIKKAISAFTEAEFSNLIVVEKVVIHRRKGGTFDAEVFVTPAKGAQDEGV